MLYLDPNSDAARVELAVVRELWESGEGDDTGDGSSADEIPHPDDDKLEVSSHSDSSDYRHQGNSRPCRFYNHDGCNRGTACAFSHAPDKKSVRDAL